MGRHIMLGVGAVELLDDEADRQRDGGRELVAVRGARDDAPAAEKLARGVRLDFGHEEGSFTLEGHSRPKLGPPLARGERIVPEPYANAMT